MTNQTLANPLIIRTERGLTIEGTRITIYDVMDYLKADWPRKLIRDWFDLSNEQVDSALHYIDNHHTEVEAEYAQVLREAKENRRYWDERNREHIAKRKNLPIDPAHENLREKFRAWQAQRGAA